MAARVGLVRCLVTVSRFFESIWYLDILLLHLLPHQKNTVQSFGLVSVSLCLQQGRS